MIREELLEPFSDSQKDKIRLVLYLHRNLTTRERNEKQRNEITGALAVLSRHLGFKLHPYHVFYEELIHEIENNRDDLLSNYFRT